MTNPATQGHIRSLYIYIIFYLSQYYVREESSFLSIFPKINWVNLMVSTAVWHGHHQWIFEIWMVLSLRTLMFDPSGQTCNDSQIRGVHRLSLSGFLDRKHHLYVYNIYIYTYIYRLLFEIARPLLTFIEIPKLENGIYTLLPHENSPDLFGHTHHSSTIIVPIDPNSSFVERFPLPSG
jgi:hypothetical protein